MQTDTTRPRWFRRFAPALFAGAILIIPDAAPATVEEQRARLPPPAECEDPVAGIWRSHSFDGPFQQWQIFTLEIHRDEDNPARLHGSITNNAWDGDATMTEPGPCTGLLHFMVSMTAEGSYDENSRQVRFGGTTWNLDQVLCGSSLGFGYNLDNFTGIIDPEIQEFQSVNNDGGRAINVPTVFRRVECFDEGADTEQPPARIEVTPPSLHPPEGGGGCNRR